MHGDHMSLTRTPESQPIRARATAALRRAAVRATMAPSVHNTQPWRFHLHDETLDVYADHDRKLAALDPTGRQLTISCGCALFNARVALAASGFAATVVRSPDPLRPELLARIVLTELDATDPDPSRLAALDDYLELRQTNRRRFTDDVSPELLDELGRAAQLEDCDLVVIRRPEDRLVVARLSQQADALEHADAAYRAELRAWTTEDRERPDGVQARSVAHAGPGAHDEVPMRDFDTHGAGVLPVETHSSSTQCMVLLTTVGDSAHDWLRTGEALERLLLEISRAGLVASPLTQAVEMPFARTQLRQALRLSLNPQVLLRIGRATPTPTSRRRSLADVLAEDG